MTHPAYDVSIIRSRDALERFLPLWSEFLTRSAAEHSVFHTAEMAYARLMSSPEALPAIVVVRSGGEIVAIAPCYTTQTRFHLMLSVIRLVGLPVTRLQMFGDEIIVAKGLDAGPIVRLVFEALRGVSYDLMFLQNLPVASQLASAFQRQHRIAGHALVLGSNRPEQVHRLRLGASFDDWLGSLGRETRKNLKSRTKRLYKEMGEDVALLRITAPHQVRAFLDNVDVIFRRTWQCRTFGYSPMNSGSRVAQLEAMAERGWLRSYLLTAQRKPIAFGINYQYEGVVYTDGTGYDHALAKHAPGTVLNYLFIEDLFNHERPALVDYGFGDAEYKRNCCTEAVAAHSVHVTRSPVWHALLLLQRALTQLETGTRAMLVRLGLDRLVRGVIKHKRAGARDEASMIVLPTLRLDDRTSRGSNASPTAAAA